MPENKTVLITGCSAGGIGHALAKQFQKRGLTVFATARSLSKMADLEGLPNTVLLSLDVTSPTQIAAAVAEVQTRTGGRLDYLVNNSGQAIYMPALHQDIDKAKDMFEVNFWGALRMIQAFTPMLIETKGTVVNIGSINAIIHPPFCGEGPRQEPILSAIYNASKAAIHSLGETLRMELKPVDIKVLTVVTGTIATNISTNVPKKSLPPDSLYMPIEGYLKKMHQGTAHPNKMKASVYAEQAVEDILSGATGKTWRGANAATVRYLPAVLPTSVRDMILTNGTGLDQVGH